MSDRSRWVDNFDTVQGLYAGAEVRAVHFVCQDRQQLRTLLQKYSKIERLCLLNTAPAAVISEFRQIISLEFESDEYTQLENLVSLTHLQSLSIADCACGGVEHFPWATFSAMTYLSLGEIDCGPDSRCKLPSALQVLHLFALPGRDWLRDLPALTELRIDAGYVHPEAIEVLTRLTNLAVALYTPDENDRSDDATQASNDAMFCTIATLLDLRVLLVNINPSDYQVQVLSALTNLTELEFAALQGRPQCSLMAVQHLCCMPKLQKLHNLHFSSHPHHYQAASSADFMLGPGGGGMFIVSPAPVLRLAITDVTSEYVGITS